MPRVTLRQRRRLPGRGDHVHRLRRHPLSRRAALVRSGSTTCRGFRARSSVSFSMVDAILQGRQPVDLTATPVLRPIAAVGSRDNAARSSSGSAAGHSIAEICRNGIGETPPTRRGPRAVMRWLRRFGERDWRISAQGGRFILLLNLPSRLAARANGDVKSLVFGGLVRTVRSSLIR
jgi:hypothetical protein